MNDETGSSSTIQIVKLNENWLNIQLINENWTEIQDLNLCCLQEVNLKFKHS